MDMVKHAKQDENTWCYMEALCAGELARHIFIPAAVGHGGLELAKPGVLAILVDIPPVLLVAAGLCHWTCF